MREFQAECLTRMKSLRDLFKILEMAYGWTLVCMAVFVLSFHPALSSWAVALSVQCVLTLAFLAGLGMNLFLRWRLQRLMDRDAPVSSVDPFEVGAEAYGFANAMINGRAISRLPAVVWIGAIGAFLALADGWIRWWAILI